MSPHLLCDDLHHWDVFNPPSSLMCIQLVKYCCALEDKTPGTLVKRSVALFPLTGTCYVCETHSTVIIPPNHTGSRYHYLILQSNTNWNLCLAQTDLPR